MRIDLDCFFIFQTFHAKVQNQFGISIRTFVVIMCRNIYLLHFSSFMNSHGSFIKHLSLIPYTSQQNGTVQRKNRHLSETARILLIQSHVILHFWGYSSQILLSY